MIVMERKGKEGGARYRTCRCLSPLKLEDLFDVGKDGCLSSLQEGWYVLLVKRWQVHSHNDLKGTQVGQL